MDGQSTGHPRTLDVRQDVLAHAPEATAAEIEDGVERQELVDRGAGAAAVLGCTSRKDIQDRM